MEDLINNLSEKLDKLLISVESLDSRINKLESASGATRSTTATTATTPTSTSAGLSESNINIQDGGSLVEDQAFSTTNYLREFELIRDRHSRIPLPQHLKLADSTTGIKNDSRPTVKVISKTARIAETGLKLLASAASFSAENYTSPSQGGSYTLRVRDLDMVAREIFAIATLTDDDLGALYTLFAAQIQFLQQEYASIVVKNTFDEETSRLFRQFENHTSAFSSSQLTNVRVAAELASISRRSDRGNRGRSESRGFFPAGQRRGFPFRGGYGRGSPSPWLTNQTFPARNDASDRRD